MENVWKMRKISWKRFSYPGKLGAVYTETFLKPHIFKISDFSDPVKDLVPRDRGRELFFSDLLKIKKKMDVVQERRES